MHRLLGPAAALSLMVLGCPRDARNDATTSPPVTTSATATPQAPGSSPTPTAPKPAPTSDRRPSNDPGCGTRPDDWCASPAGDPCGKHKNVAACRADAKCKGMPYLGESVIVCMDDGTGFAKNCPTVGCISR